MEIVLLSPSIVTPSVPNVAIPVTLRSPLTTNAVLPIPIETLETCAAGALNTPSIYASPPTHNLLVGKVVPIPRFPVDGIKDSWSGLIFTIVDPAPEANIGYLTDDVVDVATIVSSVGVCQIGVLFSPLEINT